MNHVYDRHIIDSREDINQLKKEVAQMKKDVADMKKLLESKNESVADLRGLYDDQN